MASEGVFTFKFFEDLGDETREQWIARHQKRCGKVWFDARIGEHDVHRCRCGDRYPAVRGR